MKKAIFNRIKVFGKVKNFCKMAIEQWDVLAESLRKHGMTNPVVKTVESEYGVRYCVEGPIETPSGVKPYIRTVWIVEKGSLEPRLITAYPI